MTIGSGWIIFLALLLTGFGVPLNDNLLDNFVKVVLEQFKGLMTTGLPELNIPVLDPFDVPHFNIPHISTSGIEADITIDNFVLKNLATFETQDLHVDLLKLHLDIHLTLPKLRGDAVYSLDGSIFNLLPLYGDGDMLLELNELSIDVQGGLLITADGFLQVSGLEMDANFQSANLHLDNLLGGEDFGENINNLLTAFAPAIWNEFKDEVFKEVNEALTKIINAELGKCSIAQIVGGNC